MLNQVLVHVDRWMAYNNHYFEVVPSTAMKDNRDGRRDECTSNDEPHWVPPVYFQACNLKPNLQLWTGGWKDYM